MNLLPHYYKLCIEKKNLDTELNRIFQDAFKMEIKLDYSSLQILVFRIAKHFEEIPIDPRQAFPILKNYSELDIQGDGFRSFVGVTLSILLCKDRIILLDEPEAFLHPAQARTLGIG